MGKRKCDLGGLYNAFETFGVRLADMRYEQTSQNPADQAVAVIFGLNGVYRFRFDRVESYFHDLNDEMLNLLPKILTAGDQWLMEAVPKLEYRSHQFQYSAHSRLAECRAQEFLNTIIQTRLQMGEFSVQKGVILRWTDPAFGWKVQLLLDNSLTTEEGLFLSFVAQISADRIQMGQVYSACREILDTSLARMNLAFSQNK